MEREAAIARVAKSAVIAVLLGCAAPAWTQADAAYTQQRMALVAELRRENPPGPQSRIDAAQLARVPRHAFVPAAQRRHAYQNRPLAIGYGQTISQPYIVALMTSLARRAPGQRILEVGTGSGYQAAVLAECGARVYCIELIGPPARQAPFALGLARLARLARTAPALVPWAWGLNGCASVVAAVAALLLAMAVGLRATLLCALMLYVLAAWASRPGDA